MPTIDKSTAAATKKTSAAAAKTTKTTKQAASKSKTSKTAKAAGKEPAAAKGTGDRIFSLDIGTRSVIGIVAEYHEDDEQLHVVATDRLEHTTRAMLDGQIHDVPQVAAVIEKVKKSLEAKTGPLKNAAVAAAGRALYTMTAEAEMDVNGLITAEQQRNLDFAGVQAAQAALA